MNHRQAENVAPPRGVDHHHDDHDDHPHHHHPPFAVDERVYCVDTSTAAAAATAANNGSNGNQPPPPHPPHEAVVRLMRYDARRGWSFRVHYPGWNRRWDRWVAADRLVRAADAPQPQEEPRETGNCAAANNNGGGGGKRSRGSEPRGGATTADPRHGSTRGSEPRGATKRVRSGSPSGALEQQQQPHQQWLHDDYFRDCCELPLALRTVLVEERERICGTSSCCGSATQHPRLVHALPAAVPVAKVLQHFARRQIQLCWKRQRQQQQQEMQSQDGTNNTRASATNTALTTPELVQSFCQGLQRLLAAALPACLLYPQERPQYEAFCRSSNATAPDSSAAVAAAYGCEYLLRLVVRLPGLLGPQPPPPPQPPSSAATANDASDDCWSSPAAAGPLLAELLALLQRNRQALFAGTIGGGGGSSSSEHCNYRPPLQHELCEWERRPRPRQPQHCDDNNDNNHHNHRKTSSAHEKRQQPGMASPPTSMDTR